jgi:hypothetical protein
MPIALKRGSVMTEARVRSLSPKADISYRAANACFPQSGHRQRRFGAMYPYIPIILCEERLSRWSDRMSAATLTRD